MKDTVQSKRFFPHFLNFKMTIALQKILSIFCALIISAVIPFSAFAQAQEIENPDQIEDIAEESEQYSITIDEDKYGNSSDFNYALAAFLNYHLGLMGLWGVYDIVINRNVVRGTTVTLHALVGFSVVNFLVSMSVA